MVRFISSERVDSVVVPGLGTRASNIALVRGGLAWGAPLFSTPTLLRVGHF